MEQRVMAAKGIVAMAGPCVVSRILHHAGADRIKLDIAMTLEQIAISVDKRLFESSLP